MSDRETTNFKLLKLDSRRAHDPELARALNAALDVIDTELAAAAGGGPHALGGAAHTADTLANLNAKVSDANLIDTGDARLSDARTPTAHTASHTDGSDDIQDATAGQKGLATAAQITKLDAIEASAKDDQVAADVGFTLAVGGDWSGAPAEVKAALDELASRVTVLEP